MKHFLAVLAVCTAMVAVAPSATAQTCSEVNLAGTETHYYTTDQYGGKHTEALKNMNALALIFRAAGRRDDGSLRPNDCVQLAALKLRDHLVNTRIHTGSSMWQQFLSGAYVTFVMAAGMEISGRGYMSEELDLLIRDVGEDYIFVKDSGCGLNDADPDAPVAGLEKSRRGNNCMDDYAIAASGFGWKTAYWRLSTRHYQPQRSTTISHMRNSLLDNESICVHSPSLYTLDSTMSNIYEAPICNRPASDLDVGDSVLLSLNHGNQAPAYGFGLLSSFAAGAVALEVINHPITQGEFSPNEKKALKYLWKEMVDHTDASTGLFHSNTRGNASCYNVAGAFTGPRTLAGNWGCEDQQFGWGDPTEGNTNWSAPYFGEPARGYDARWYPMATFYDRYGFTKGTGSGYAFSTFYEDPLRPFTNGIGDFYGPARYETYKNLSSVWFNSRPPLTARSEFRLSIATYNSSGYRYLLAANGGGGAVTVTATSPGVTNANFELVDLNGAVLNSGDTVAVRVKNASNQIYYLTAPGIGGTVSATATSHAGTTEQWIIEKVSVAGSSSGTLISHNDYFALKSVANGKYMEAVNGGGGNVVTNTSVFSNFARFRFSKTELPRRTYP